MVAALASKLVPANVYLDALLRQDRAASQRVVDDVLRDSDLNSVYVDVLQPAMYELGARWERGEINVAQEHFCTAATQQVMATLHAALVVEASGGRRLLATSVGGNRHSVGIRMVADVFELHGWSVMFAGADTPTESVVATLADGSFDMLAISAALPDHVPEVEELVRTVRATKTDVRILVGGGAFRADPELWRRVGADGYAATPAQALTLAETLTTAFVARRTLTLVAPSVAPSIAHALEQAQTLEAMSEINTELHDMARALVAKNAELAQVNAQLNRVMGVIAHDLRNPLSVIIHYSQFLREDLAATLGDEQRGFLDLIDSSGGFMRELLDDLLDTARLRAGKLTLEPELVELDAFVREISALNQHLAQRKGMELHVTSSASGLRASIDRSKMRQVINNLVSNAIKYSPAGTTVELELAAQDTAITIGVRDHGLGIAADELSKLFIAFETTRTRGTAGEKSTGLGLAIVRAIVEAHGGRVEVETTLGQGSVFTVTLPRG